MTHADIALIILIAGTGEILAFYIYKFLIWFLNREKNMKVDRAVVKGVIERLFLFPSLVYGFPQALIAFGALKIGTRFVKEANKISNDYFYIGNIVSLLIALIYYALWVQIKTP